jgi:hypothetical protein
MSVKKWNPGAKEEKKEGTEDTKGKKSKVEKGKKHNQTRSKEGTTLIKPCQASIYFQL